MKGDVMRPNVPAQSNNHEQLVHARNGSSHVVFVSNIRRASANRTGIGDIGNYGCARGATSVCFEGSKISLQANLIEIRHLGVAGFEVTGDNVETLGDYLLLKRIEADLSQPELVVKSSVTVRKIKAWEHYQSLPTEGEWELLAKILNLEVAMRPTS